MRVASRATEVWEPRSLRAFCACTSVGG